MKTQNHSTLRFYYFILVLFVVLLTIGQISSAQAGENLQKAAESGDVTAQFELGQYYRKGARSLDDFRKAYFWTREAAEQGMAKAQFFVADMYCSGSGVAQSYIYAYAWHSLAAKGGITAAEGKMEMLEQLFLTPDDIKKALKIEAEIEEKINL